MQRTPSRLAQLTFNAANGLHILSKHSNLVIRETSEIFRKIVTRFLLPVVGANHTVEAYLYGRAMQMPAEHPLSSVLHEFPQYNRPLAVAVSALSSYSGSSELTVIDVGANIGETVAVVDQLIPGVSYLCIEADQDIARMCEYNHRNNPRVQTKQGFIGEREGALVRLEDDGRANPSTKLVDPENHDGASDSDRLVRLDTAAGPFAKAHGGLSLIKVDTEGYDFSVLRSASALLASYKPALYFEWFPELLTGLKEEVWGGFDYLESFGYKHFVFFSGQGDYYCHLSTPDHFILHSLASTAKQNKALLYFDVFASTDETICKKLVELAILPMNSPSFSRANHHDHRQNDLQPSRHYTGAMRE
jgi:FkbM family methyltransferase